MTVWVPWFDCDEAKIWEHPYDKKASRFYIYELYAVISGYGVKEREMM